MNDMYKLLDEHSNDKKLIDPNGAGAPHLAFVQSSKGKFHGGKQLKCHKCGLPNYTVYTCPNCNNNRPNNAKHQSSNAGKHVKFQKGILKNKKGGKAFAQVSQGKRTKSYKKNKSNDM